jgi:hypothetical protein
MPSIKEVQSDLRAFDKYARTVDSAPALQKKWKSLTSQDLTEDAANAFVSYYRNMRSSSKKMRGGSAPLHYQMIPGANVSVYGRFPVEVDTDPASIRDLDVFFNSGMSHSCGKENTSLTVPENMGSNKVGGSRRHRSRRAHAGGKRNTQRKRNAMRRRTLRRRNMRRFHGGNLLESVAMRPFLATAPPNILQTSFHNASGGVPPMPVPASPVSHTWEYMSNGTGGLINPGDITRISADMTKLASPAPWQTAN